MTSEATSENGAADAIRTEGIAKRFGAVVALSDVSMHLKKGEVLGLIGDNGAGKSTLIKILCGFLHPDAGRIFVDGEEVHLRSVTHARSLGIDTVYQDLALVPSLSVYHNMFLRRELERRLAGLIPVLDNRKMRARARQYLDDMGVKIPSLEAEVAVLSGGQRQSIALARSVYSGNKILFLDEPLAAMGAKESRMILDLLSRLKETGQFSMMVIAHNYVHVLELCDRINLLQHGRITFDKQKDETSVEELTELVAREYRVGAA